MAVEQLAVNRIPTEALGRDHKPFPPGLAEMVSPSLHVWSHWTGNSPPHGVEIFCPDGKHTLYFTGWSIFHCYLSSSLLALKCLFPKDYWEFCSSNYSMSVSILEEKYPVESFRVSQGLFWEDIYKVWGSSLEWFKQAIKEGNCLEKNHGGDIIPSVWSSSEGQVFYSFSRRNIHL